MYIDDIPVTELKERKKFTLCCFLVMPLFPPQWIFFYSKVGGSGLPSGPAYVIAVENEKESRRYLKTEHVHIFNDEALTSQRYLYLVIPDCGMTAPRESL